MKPGRVVIPITLACLVMPLACAASDGEPVAGVAPQQMPMPRENPKAWFACFFKTGAPCPAIWDVPPTLLTGKEIIALVTADKLASQEVANDPVFLQTIQAEQRYWYWTKQGPMSDHQMHVVMKGDTTTESVIVYAKIQERPCM